MEKTTKKRTWIILSIICLILLAVMIYLSNFYLSNNGEKYNEKQNPTKKFSDYEYYLKENSKRYVDYKNNNPMIRSADIIWMVNMGLDDEFYNNAEIVEDPDDTLVLVNKHNMLPMSFEPDKLVSIGGDFKARPEVAKAYKEMIADAKEAGMAIKPQSGFRSYKVQSILYEDAKAADPENVDTYSARAGYSEHQTGLAIDMNVPDGGELYDFIGTDQAKWVAENCYKYGFIIRYTEANKNITGYMPEPWHVRYIGIDHAKKMKEEGMGSFEEYTAKFLTPKEAQDDN